MRSASVERRRDVLVHGRSKCSKSCSRALVNRKWLDRTKTRMERSPFPLFLYSCKNLISSSVKSKVESRKSKVKSQNSTPSSSHRLHYVYHCPHGMRCLFYLPLLNLHHVPGPSAPPALDALGPCIPPLTTFLT